jgi:hypothetical protein
MALKMSKNDKALFYYLGLTLLVLIVLGAVFGISSVKESFGIKQDKRKARRVLKKCCIAEGGDLEGDAAKSRRKLCRAEIKKKNFTSCQ